MAKTSNPTKEKNPRENERNFRLSDEAANLLDKVKENRGNMSDFVSKCIVNYGPMILEGAESSADKIPPLSARLKYLEEIVVPWAYDELMEDWDASTLKAHQDILKSTDKKVWHNAASIKKIVAVAAENPKTEDTEPCQWQTLLRRRREFLALKK